MSGAFGPAVILPSRTQQLQQVGSTTPSRVVRMGSLGLAAQAGGGEAASPSKCDVGPLQGSASPLTGTLRTLKPGGSVATRLTGGFQADRPSSSGSGSGRDCARVAPPLRTAESGTLAGGMGTPTPTQHSGGQPGQGKLSQGGRGAAARSTPMWQCTDMGLGSARGAKARAVTLTGHELVRGCAYGSCTVLWGAKQRVVCMLPWAC